MKQKPFQSKNFIKSAGRKGVLALLALLLALGLSFMGTGRYHAQAADLMPEAIETLKEEYAEAGVVLDIYRIGLYDGSGYVLENSYKVLNLKETDREELAQNALKLTFTKQSDHWTQAVSPVYSSKELDQEISNLLLGVYLILPHGKNLSADDYLKSITNEAGTEKLVTIAKTEEYEYRFSPILLFMDASNYAPAKFDVKAERTERYGRLRIQKSVTTYNSAHPATFVFQVTGMKDGKEVFSDVAGLTLSGTGSGYVDMNHIPVGTSVTVKEIYAGSDLAQISEDPAPVVIGEADEPVVVTVGGEASVSEPKKKVSFTNAYVREEKQGSGITNSFTYNGSSWMWYQDGILQTNGEIEK